MSSFKLIPVFILFSLNSVAAEKTPSLCQKPETEIFNCQLKGKTLSLCGSSDFSKQSGTIQYRFGTLKTIELNYPENPEPPTGKFWSSVADYSGGGESRIHFKNGGYDYIVFENTIRTSFTPDNRHNPVFNAGLVTKQGAKILSIRRCSNDAQILQPVLKFIPEEEFDYDVTP
jgi:hypothetical protein